MRPMIVVAVRAMLLSVAAATALAGLAGVVRLLPWVLAPDVPWQVVAPFAEALAGVAIEAGVLLGVPVALALTASRWVERGEALALHGLGASPTRVVLRLAPGVVALALTASSLGAVVSRDVRRPGRFAQALLDEGRESCQTARSPKSIPVPMVGLSWLCSPGHTPRLVGRVPGVATPLWMSAAALEPSDDLARMRVGDIELAARSQKQRPGLRLRAQTAKIRGLPSWGPPPRLDPWIRVAMLTALASSLALGCAGAVLWRRVASRAVAFGMASGISLGCLWGLHALDRAHAAPWLYLTLPVGGLSLSGALGFLYGRVSESGAVSTLSRALLSHVARRPRGW